MTSVVLGFVALGFALVVLYRFIRWMYDLGWKHGHERGRLRGELEENVRRARAMSKAAAEARAGGRITPSAYGDCTGAGASWCPIHGTCTCPYDVQVGYRRDEEGGIDPRCPLHGDASEHATPPGMDLTDIHPGGPS